MLTLPNYQLVIPQGASTSNRAGLIVNYVNNLYSQYGLSHWRFGFANAKSRAGVCKCRSKIIQLTSFFALHNTTEEITNTILHEIAHALDFEQRGTSDHSYAWKSIALAIGCTGDRCYSSKDVAMPLGKYVYECPNCSNEMRRHKRTRTNIACSKCCGKHNHGRYSDKFKYQFKGVRTGELTIPSKTQIPRIAPVVPIENRLILMGTIAANNGKVIPTITTAQDKPLTKTAQMIQLYNNGTTSVSKIAELVNAHYSHVHSVITKHKTTLK